jgi:S1-C subfamily serine protease
LDNPLLSLSTHLAALVEQSGPAVVGIHSHSRAGASGVHWQPGIIVTAEHALRRDDEIRIVTPNGDQLKAELAGRDPGTDLAVLKVPGLDAPVAVQTAVTQIRAGNLALAIGRARDGRGTASLGIVSSAGGPWQTWRGGRLDRYLRLDLAVYPGASGGAVIDASGQVVGIATVALSRTSPIAIPNETVNRVAAALLAHGTVPRGYLGVGLQPVALPEHLRTRLNLSQETGLIIISVQPDGPADRGGVLMGDLLVELAGKPVADTDDVQVALDAGSVGKSVHARIIRAGAPVDLDITIGQRPGRSC